jgi:uncharacterized protein (TIGR04222 family)
MTPRSLHLLLITLVMLGTISTPASARERDPLAPIESMEAHQFEAFPETVVSEDNAKAITALVNEARLFGVPLSVRVISLPTDNPALRAFNDIDSSAQIPMETVHEMARAWMDDEPIESSPGAEDGFLMFVVIPEDHTLSSAVIEPGPNALPLNGLTQANIDQVINELVMPNLAENHISQGIRAGLSVFSYNNLFGKPERIALDPLHEDLQMIAGVPLAGVTAASGLALVGLAFWIHRRTTGSEGGNAPEPLSPIAASALHEGRVNDAVVTGGLLHLIRMGALSPDGKEDFSLRVSPERGRDIQDPFAKSIHEILWRHADTDGVVLDAAARRLHDLMQPAKAGLEDDLARRGLFNRNGRVELAWLVLASALVAVIALFALLPSILGMARTGIFSIIVAALCITGVLVWGSRRSWTTNHGQAALAAWRENASPEELATFDTVANQDALVSAQGGPFVPPTVSLVRDLRGIGAT